MSKILKATHEGELPLGDRIISCAVLDDGTRILAAAAVFKALERPRKGKSSETYRADQMPSFLNANNLQPFVDQEVKEWTELIEYEGLNGAIKTGYNAKLLRGICKVYLEARKAGKILKTQEKTVDVVEKMLYALADKGIESLVDKATGFDKLKDDFKQKVALFLQKSLQLDPAKWVKKFDDDFFEMIFKMKNWTWSNSTKRPGVIGHYINDIVYSRIAPNILSELQKLNPKIEGSRNNKHHQHLTDDFGSPALKDHLKGLITLGRASGYNWDLFYALLDKAYPKFGQTLKLDFAIEYDKKLLNSPIETSTLSNFDQKLITALSYNPKDKAIKKKPLDKGPKLF